MMMLVISFFTVIRYKNGIMMLRMMLRMMLGMMF